MRRLRAELERQRAGSGETDRRLAELESKVDRLSITKGIVQARVAEFETLKVGFALFPSAFLLSLTVVSVDTRRTGQPGAGA